MPIVKNAERCSLRHEKPGVEILIDQNSVFLLFVSYERTKSLIIFLVHTFVVQIITCIVYNSGERKKDEIKRNNKK